MTDKIMPYWNYCKMKPDKCPASTKWSERCCWKTCHYFSNSIMLMFCVFFGRAQGKTIWLSDKSCSYSFASLDNCYFFSCVTHGFSFLGQLLVIYSSVLGCWVCDKSDAVTTLLSDSTDQICICLLSSFASQLPLLSLSGLFSMSPTDSCHQAP